MAAMKVLILFAVFGFMVVDGEVFQQKLIRVESRKTKMIKEGTWDEYYKNKQLVQQSFDASQNMEDFDEVEYVATISIGNPSLTFKMHYNLLSSETWVTDKACGENTDFHNLSICYEPNGSEFCFPLNVTEIEIAAQEICDQKLKFDYTKSKTFNFSTDPFFDSYDFEFGYISVNDMGKDVIMLQTNYTDSVGPLNAELDFLKTKEMSPVFADTPFDGVLGIGLRSTFWGQISQNFDRPIFTVYLQNTGNEYNVPGGFITFGGIDEEHCSSEMAHSDYPQSDLSNYQFSVMDLAFGSTPLDYYAHVSLDTSRTSIYGPNDLVQNIKTAAEQMIMAQSSVMQKLKI